MSVIDEVRDSFRFKIGESVYYSQVICKRNEKTKKAIKVIVTGHFFDYSNGLNGEQVSRFVEVANEREYMYRLAVSEIDLFKTKEEALGGANEH